MLPQQMFAGNENTLSVETLPYSTVEDLFDTVAVHKPDIVFLLSGYLFSSDGFVSQNELDILIRQMQERVSVVATSDPFVGLASLLTQSDVDINMSLLGQPLIKRIFYRMAWKFRKLDNFMRVSSMESLTHLYATSLPPTDDKDKSPKLAFFNPNILKSMTDAPESASKRWLFVLSSTDLGCQNADHGEAEFARIVVRILAQALDSGRKPTLLAPAAILDIVSGEFPDSSGVEKLQFCPYTEFVPRLLDAEYVFYWNVFSCSLLLRMANELPLFFFDRGHLSRTIIPFYDHGLRTHFGEWTPTYLDQEDSLNPNSLAKLAMEQKPALRAVREYWQASPTPEQVIDQMLKKTGRPNP